VFHFCFQVNATWRRGIRTQLEFHVQEYWTVLCGLVESGVQCTITRMNLQQYFSEEPRGAKIEMARHLGITAEWMSKLIAEKVKPSAMLARELENATQGLVTRRDLRPDLFG
jgi:hypothetical protein